MVMRQMRRQQRRVYSLESNKMARTVFARKYVSYLLPALKKIYEEKTTTSLNQNDDGDYSKLEKIVGYQVKMAMVLSASTYQFAWSRALKRKLQTSYVLKYGKSVLPRHHFPKPLNFRPYDPNCNLSKMKRYHYFSNYNMPNRVRPHFQEGKLASNGNTKKNEEEEMIGRKLSSLRRILPGGNEMGENELLAEVGSYITCLQLQVNILRRLVGN